MTPTPEPTNSGWVPSDAEARNRSGLLLDRYDAWLAAHDAQVAEKAWDEAVAMCCQMLGARNVGWHNPYRKAADDA